MITYNDQISEYINEIFVRQDDILNRILENISDQGIAEICIQPEEGLFLQFLTTSIGAIKVVEIGTLGGYSGVWLARGLLPGGKLITIEKDANHAEIARDHFRMAGLQDIVSVRVGMALIILEQLRKEGPFDLVFIDADKSSYQAYLNWAIENLRVGGIVAAHNAFSKGTIIDRNNRDASAEVMRNFHKLISNEPRLISTIFPAGDGTVIAVKIS